MIQTIDLDSLSYFQLLALHAEVSWKLFWPSLGIICIIGLTFLFIIGVKNSLENKGGKN